MSYIFVKLHWETDPVVPVLLYFKRGSEQLLKKPLKIGDILNLRLTGNKYCIGSEVSRGNWKSCITVHRENGYDNDSEEKVINPYKQCILCMGRDFFNCRMTCIGDVCTPSTPSAQKYCIPPETYVYLTSIGNRFKVGVSLSLPRRWLEQGSDLAVAIAQLPGLEARRLEHLIAGELGITLQVRNSYKIKNLSIKSKNTRINQLNELIIKTKPIINRIIASMPQDMYSVLPGEIIDLTNYYGALNFVNPPEEIIPTEDAQFGSKIIGIKGSLIIASHENHIFILDTKKLSSHEFFFIDQIDIKSNSVIDEWF